jgi:hypothetical protein
MGRAIGADNVIVLAHIQVDVGVVKGRQRADALELLGTYLNLGEAISVVEVRRGAVCHGQTRSDWNGRTILQGKQQEKGDGGPPLGLL